MSGTFYSTKVGSTLFVRPVGHITAAVCPGFRTELTAKIDLENIVIDLSACTYVDSTFLGVIAGVAKQRKTRHRPAIGVFEPTSVCWGLFQALGVDRLVDRIPQTTAVPAQMEPIAEPDLPDAAFVLDSHEALSALSADNASRFAALQSVLKKRPKN